MLLSQIPVHCWILVSLPYVTLGILLNMVSWCFSSRRTSYKVIAFITIFFLFHYKLKKIPEFWGKCQVSDTVLHNQPDHVDCSGVYLAGESPVHSAVLLMPSHFATRIIGQLMINSGWEMVMVMKGRIQQAGGCKIHEFVLLRLESTELTVPDYGGEKKTFKNMNVRLCTYTCPSLSSSPCLQ